MGRDFNMVFAGFGGQGVLFAGKVVVESALFEDRELSWMPSYGPEMRGGTANCSVCISDEPIGSPLVLEPNVLFAMNQPSYDKFIGSVGPGAVVLADSVLCPTVKDVEGVSTFTAPFSQLAEENGLKGLANVVMVGKLWKETHFCEEETLFKAIEACVPPKKAHLLEPNKKALRLGMSL